MAGQGKIAVIGGGAWGTALAANAVRAGSDTVLWARDSGTVDAINSRQSNPAYLPEIDLPKKLQATADMAAACDGAAIILLAIPAQTVSAMIAAIAPLVAGDAVIVSCAKGIDGATGETMTGVIGHHIDEDRLAVLSGPSFAVDVARGLPTAVTVAAGSEARALDLCRALSSETLRAYANTDLIGVQWGGALKNVLAIATGIARGRGLGASAEAAVTARGFAELSRIVATMGGKPETIAGLSGLGDLILTCGSEKSRNLSYGIAIGRGADLAGMKLAEGATTAGIAARMAASHAIEAPLVNAVASVLDKSLSVDDAIAELLSRPDKD